MLSEDVDIEEIEAILYAQVFHRQLSEDTSSNVSHSISDVNIEVLDTGAANEEMRSGQKKNFRYFNVDYTQKGRVCEEFKNPVNTSGINQIASVERDSAQNWNIPPHINRNVRNQNELETFKDWEKAPRPWELPGNGKGRLKRRNRRKKIPQHLKELLSKTKEEKVIQDDRQEESITGIIYLIESDDELPISDKNVPVDSPKNDDDEIIYVSPPSVSIINLDSDSEPEKEQPETERPVVEPEEEVSNDFLANDVAQSSSENFDFTQHGTDFTNADFARPTNPTEHYETESSTSTSELAKDTSRNFNNSVKTIVFSEVEFPKNDIFTANNMEGFKNLIDVQSAAPVKATKRLSENTTPKKASISRRPSDSSSESDYEPPERLRRLPNLSPLVARKESPNKSKKKTPSSKRDNMEGGNDEQEKTLNDNNETEQTPKKKSKKKKKKLDQAETLQSTDSVEDTGELPVTQDSSVITSTSNQELEGIQDSTKRKNKKKKRKTSKPEQSADCNEGLDKTEEQVINEENVEPPVSTEDINTVEEANTTLNDDRDVILIEKTLDVVEVLDSSDGEDTLDLHLANTSINTVSVTKEVDNDYSGFDVHNVQGNMSDNPELWQINSRDRDKFITSKPVGPRCNRCRQFGHIAVKCPNKPLLPICSLCSDMGHEEPRCPNKVCFSCGNPGSYSTVYCWKCIHNRKKICNLCNVAGHIANTCPDLWRRYHLTTKEGPLVTPQDGAQMKPKDELWCSGCAQQGHLEFECTSRRYIQEYPAASPAIFQYSNVYSQGNCRRNNRTSTQISPNILANNMPNYAQQSQLVPQNIFPVLANSIISNQILSLLNTANNNLNNGPSLVNSALLPNPYSLLQNVPSGDVQVPPNNNFPTENRPNTNKSFKSKTCQDNIEGILVAKFRHEDLESLWQFVNEELEKLTKLNADPNFYRKKLNTALILEKLTPQSIGMKKRLTRIYGDINMYVFGVKKLQDGQRHVDYLRNFIYQPGYDISEGKRRLLHIAYTYIFGSKHSNISYKKLLNTLIVTDKAKKRRF